MHVAIVGNSAAGLSALESFRARDQRSRVTLVSGEAGPAYSRVLLPYYLRRKLSYDRLFIRKMGYYTHHDAEVLFETRVEQVDAARRSLEFADGRSLGFDRLLLATGSRPAKPPIAGLEGPGVHHLWTLEDALQLDRAFREGARVLVLGAGFVALQAAWAARRRGLDVTVIELAEQILPRVLDAPAARVLHDRILEHGVAVHTSTRTDGVERDRHGALRIFAAGLEPFTVDLVIVGTGVRPNDGLLPEALAPGRPGIPVAATMETVVDGVFAAGDVARGPTADGGPREIHALWPTAVEHGRVAGANLAGAGVVYGGSLSMNVTEMFGVTVGSLGRIAEDQGDVVVVRSDLAGIEHLKVVSRAGVPVGALVIGGHEGAVLLGRLRSYVRQRRQAPDMQDLIDRRDLDQNLTGAGALRRAGSHLEAPKEEPACVSSR